MLPMGKHFRLCSDLIITVIVMLRLHAGRIRFVVDLGGHQLMDAVRLLAHPAQLHFEEFVFHLVVHLENATKGEEKKKNRKCEHIAKQLVANRPA